MGLTCAVSRYREQGTVTQVLLFVVVSGLAGVLVAGLFVPFAGLLGLGARNTVDTFEALPSQLETPPPPERSNVLDARGNVLATFFDQNRVNVPMDQISPLVRKAVVAIEDKRFYKHGPMDFKGTMRAFVRNSQSGDTDQGGSSLTQQYIKLVRQQTAKTPKERREALEESYGRKLEELRYAVGIEKKMSKDQILNNYLNLVFFGSQSYGVQAAAKRYFNTTAQDLTLSQSAMLAAMIRNPSGLKPRSDPEPVVDRRNLVLEMMANQKLVPRVEVEKAKKEPLGLDFQLQANGCFSSQAQFFCDYTRQWLLKEPALGKTKDQRERYLLDGGLTIQSTLDPKVQKAATKAIKERANRTDQPIAALSMVQPGTGRVQAMAQSKPMGNRKGDSYINFNAGRDNNGGVGFQPGSSFKPFVMAAAIKQGISLYRSYPSPKSMVQTGSVKTCKGWVKDAWPVSNSTESGSSSTIISGTARSVNTFYANLEADTGVCEPWKIATNLGVQRGDGDPLMQVKSFVLGVNEVSPISMAEAYATFAAHGKHCDATPVTRVDDRGGNALSIRDGACKQALPRDVADKVAQVLMKVVDGSVSGATGTRQQLDGDRDTAGKTGTNDSNKAVWFMGFTTQLATAAVVATPDNTTLNGKTVGGEYIGSASGGGTAGSMWSEAMQEAMEDKPKKALGQSNGSGSSEPSDSDESSSSEVPYVVGTSSSNARDQLGEAGFEFRTGGYVDSAYPSGTVARQSPGGGNRTQTGDPVTLYLSNGNGDSDDN